MGNCKNKQKQENEILYMINKMLMKKIEFNENSFSEPYFREEKKTKFEKMRKRMNTTNHDYLKIAETQYSTEFKPEKEKRFDEIHHEPFFHPQNNGNFVPIFSWNNLRIGMTHDGIMCITNTVDDSSLWSININEKGVAFKNKKTNKYANPKINGGINSWSIEPVYFSLFSAQIFEIELYGDSKGLPYIAKDLDGNKTRCVLIKNSDGLCWNIWEDQKGEGAWIILYKEEIQGSYSGQRKENESWMIEKKFPTSWSGLKNGLKWKKEI